MDNLPNYVTLVFSATLLLAVFLFYKATNDSKTFIAIVCSWIALQTFVSISGFYTITHTIPPRATLLLLPPLLVILVVFSTNKGRLFIERTDLKTLTIFHIIRIPVELVLFWLFVLKAVPELMTFEGRNFDILSGISAPFMYYYGFVKKKLNSRVLLAWNIICLGLLINIVVNAILSLPGMFQQFAFEQPNIAVLHFPFVLLPSLLVPLVLFSHLASIRKLLHKNSGP